MPCDLRPPVHALLHGLPSAAPAANTAEPEAGAPAVRRQQLGESVRGAPLVAEVFGDGPDVLLVIGGIHGNEPTSAALARRTAGYLRAHPELWAGRTIAVLAEANPDGLAAGTRANARGVDLNRNFPARNWRARGDRRFGAQPASEPETAAIVRAVEELQPRRILSIHSAVRIGPCNNYDGPASELAERLAACNGYPVRPSIGYPTPGSLGSWAGGDRGIPVVTLELPAELSEAQCWRGNGRALLAFVRGTGATAGQ
ncbi:MAG: M14 family zinc carboxypeptidase [Planctomycetota bacterium]